MSEPRHLELVADLVPHIAEHAVQVDASGDYPRASIDAFLASPLAGLISAEEVGGMGGAHRQAVEVVEAIARVCGSSAMIVCMHYAGTHVIETHGDEATRRAIAKGEHLSTLAFSERGSRSQFWAPVSTARRDGDAVIIDAQKSWITSAHHASAFVWSSKPLGDEGASTLWLVPRGAEGLSSPRPFDGMGLRGNDSAPMVAEGVKVAPGAQLGEDGKGMDIMLGTVLPLFNCMTSAVAVGFMGAATDATAKHVSGTGFEHTQSALRDLPTVRAYLARMRIETDKCRTLLFDTISALEAGREDAVLRVLETKAASGEAATQVLDLAMRVCGGAAFRRDVGVERIFRDARAGTVMAPTTDHLYDFIGKALTGMELFA